MRPKNAGRTGLASADEHAERAFATASGFVCRRCVPGGATDRAARLAGQQRGRGAAADLPGRTAFSEMRRSRRTVRADAAFRYAARQRDPDRCGGRVEVASAFAEARCRRGSASGRRRDDEGRSERDCFFVDRVCAIAGGRRPRKPQSRSAIARSLRTSRSSSTIRTIGMAFGAPKSAPAPTVAIQSASGRLDGSGLAAFAGVCRRERAAPPPSIHGVNRQAAPGTSAPRRRLARFRPTDGRPSAPARAPLRRRRRARE